LVDSDDVLEAYWTSAATNIRGVIVKVVRAPAAVTRSLADARSRFPLPVEAFTDLLDGVQMDVEGTRFTTFDELLVYSRAVAGSIGRICVGIFGASDLERAIPLADDLGVAMQITNVLRDVREDFERGRVYLPAEDLRRFGCEEDLSSSPADATADLIRFETARGREWFARGLELLPLLDARSKACVRAMTGIYRRILGQIDRDPQQVLRRRVSLPAWETLASWSRCRSKVAGPWTARSPSTVRTPASSWSSPANTRPGSSAT